MRRTGRRGAATMEFALIYASLLLPLTMMLIFTAQLLWAWHSAVDFTREGARYAATHCWQPGSGNVIGWMRTNAPPVVNRDQIVNGEVELEVIYFSKDQDSGALTEFSCEGTECSRECVPDTVRVRLVDFEFRSFMSYLGLPPVPMPNFQTSLPMESAGCSADSEECLP